METLDLQRSTELVQPTARKLEVNIPKIYTFALKEREMRGTR